jgi:arylformamidase
VTAAAWLADQRVAVVGADTDTVGPAAGTLADAGVPVLTGLRGLDDLPPDGFRLHAVPYPSGDGERRARVCGVVADSE